jgi:hypothetical protein
VVKAADTPRRARVILRLHAPRERQRATNPPARGACIYAQGLAGRHSGQHVAVCARGHVRDFSGFFARNPSKTHRCLQPSRKSHKSHWVMAARVWRAWAYALTRKCLWPSQNRARVASVGLGVACGGRGCRLDLSAAACASPSSVNDFVLSEEPAQCRIRSVWQREVSGQRVAARARVAIGLSWIFFAEPIQDD